MQLACAMQEHILHPVQHSLDQGIIYTIYSIVQCLPLQNLFIYCCPCPYCVLPPLQIRDQYEVQGKRSLLQLYGIPFGLVGFLALVYLGFFRPFDDDDQKTYDSIISTLQSSESSETGSSVASEDTDK